MSIVLQRQELKKPTKVETMELHFLFLHNFFEALEALESRDKLFRYVIVREKR